MNTALSGVSVPMLGLPLALPALCPIATLSVQSFPPTELFATSLPIRTLVAPAVIPAPALRPIITLLSPSVIALPAPTPIITLPAAAFKVPVVVSPILILFEKLVTLNNTSSNSFNLLAPEYSPVATPADV